LIGSIELSRILRQKPEIVIPVYSIKVVQKTAQSLHKAPALGEAMNEAASILKLHATDPGPLRLSLQSNSGEELLVLLNTIISDEGTVIRLKLDEVPEGARYLVLESGAGRFIRVLPG
jgi:hypothetical protein